jgi:hypothetical protein
LGDQRRRTRIARYQGHKGRKCDKATDDGERNAIGDADVCQRVTATVGRRVRLDGPSDANTDGNDTSGQQQRQNGGQ